MKFPRPRNKTLGFLALVAASIVVSCTASVAHYIYDIPMLGVVRNDRFLGFSEDMWILLRYIGLLIFGAIALFFYHLYMKDKMKKMEDKFSSYLKDLDELNEEWADENHELWEFVEDVAKEKDIKRVKRKARKLLKYREENKKSR